MKKVISVLLVLSMLLGTLALSATAAEGKSITLPFVYTTDDLGNDALKYTVAVTCNGDHIPEPEDPDPADGVTPEKAPCAEHTTVIFCKLGETSDDPDIDYTISYDMSVYGMPDENGEITGIDESFFDFTVTMDDKYIQKVTITANGTVIEPNATTGRYVLPMNYSYYLEIPEPDQGYPNFDLRSVKVTFPATNTKEGYNLYSFDYETYINDPVSDKPNLYERQNGTYGEDYYVKLLVKDGYRECLSNVQTDADDFNQDEYPMQVTLYASTVPNSPLPPLDSADMVYHVANIYQYKANGNTVYKYDFFDTDTDDIDTSNTAYTLVGRVYKVDGEVMKAQSVELMVQGITADTTNTIFNWLFRIIRMIINLFKNLNIFG